MNRSIAVLISAGVTTLVMTVIGVGIGAAALEFSDAGQTPAPTVINVAPGVDYAQREAQYKALLAQANQRIQDADQRLRDANTRIEQANTQIRQLQQAAQAQPATQQVAQARAPATNSEDEHNDDETAPTITAEQAARIALRAARGTTLLQTPDLVDYQSQTVYRVLLDAGTIYIDPQTGTILAAIPNR